MQRGAWPEQAREEANARAFVAVYVSRGKFVPGACADCGSRDVVPYHADPKRHREFEWLCRDDRDRRRESATSAVRQAAYRSERDEALAAIALLPPEDQASLHAAASRGRLRPSCGSPLYNQYLTAAYAVYRRSREPLASRA